MTKKKIILEISISMVINFIIVIYFVSLTIPDYAYIYPSYIQRGVNLMIFTVIIAIIFSMTILITVFMGSKRASKNAEIKYLDTASSLVIIGSSINIDGGIFLMWSSLNLMSSYGLFLIPLVPIIIVIIIGAIIGLKYPKGASITCLILGLLLVLFLAALLFNIPPLGIGLLLTIIGSIVGLIGVSRRKKKDLPKRTENIINLSTDL